MSGEVAKIHILASDIISNQCGTATDNRNDTRDYMRPYDLGKGMMREVQLTVCSGTRLMVVF